jgi:hypothetical protein
MQIFCPQCATGNDLDAVTCDNCGAVLRPRRRQVEEAPQTPLPLTLPQTTVPITGERDMTTCPQCKQVVQLPKGQPLDQTFQCGHCHHTFMLTSHPSGWVRPGHLSPVQQVQRATQRAQRTTNWLIGIGCGLPILGILLLELIAWLRPSPPDSIDSLRSTLRQEAEQARQRNRQEIAAIEKGDLSLPITHHQVDFLRPRIDQFGKTCYEYQISGTIQNKSDSAVQAHVSAFIWDSEDELIEAEGWTRTIPAHGTAIFTIPDWTGQLAHVPQEQQDVFWLHEYPARYTVGAQVQN